MYLWFAPGAGQSGLTLLLHWQQGLAVRCVSRNGRPAGAQRRSSSRLPATISAAEPRLQVTKGGEINKPFSGTGTTTAKFSAPGDYALQLLATDYSGEGGNGEVCCWTNAYLKVTVK